jgi:multidrug efflux pump subunit AcrA (membrane-fusion protein)
MMRRTFLFLGWLGLVWFSRGWAAEAPAGTAPDAAAFPAGVSTKSAEKIATRNNAASLLYQLVLDEKNASLLLLVKGNRPDVNNLVKAISTTAGDAVKNLLVLAKADPSLNLHATDLPAGEVAVRAAITKIKTHQLLLATGDNFEFALLLTQADALSYGYNLAQTALDNATDPAQRGVFTALRDTMKTQYQQVIAFIRGPAK